MHERHGIGRLELLVAILAVVVLIAVILPARRPRNDVAYQLRDATSLKEIHQSLLIHAREHDGVLPTPGLINRAREPYLDREIQDVGPEDSTLNTTANLYSALIALEHFPPELVVSLRERNPVVQPAVGYNWDAYDPQNDVYWDPGFVADLDTGSNASYGHLPLIGIARKLQWRDSRDSDVAILGHRGPMTGIASRESLSCRPDGSWPGSFVFADNHVETVPAKSGQRIGASLFIDNPFAMEANPSTRDTTIAFTRSITDGRAVLQHD